LKILAKECSLTDVSHNTCREEMTRDSFQWSGKFVYKQHLLQMNDLTLV